MSETRIDLMKAWPGEKYCLRFLGSPHRRFRFYWGGGFIDIIDPKEASLLISRGYKGVKEYWGVAIDRATDTICVVEIPDELFTLLVSCSQATGDSIASVEGADVVIETTAITSPRFLVRLGDPTEVSQDTLNTVKASKDDIAADILNMGSSEEIRAMGKEDFFTPTTWIPTIIDFEDMDAVEEKVKDEKWKRLLLTFAIYVSETGDDKVTAAASNLIRTLRKNEQ